MPPRKSVKGLQVLRPCQKLVNSSTDASHTTEVFGAKVSKAFVRLAKVRTIPVFIKSQLNSALVLLCTESHQIHRESVKDIDAH